MDPHFAEPAMVCIEQTHNRLGGRVLTLEYMAALADWYGVHAAAETALSRRADI